MPPMDNHDIAKAAINHLARHVALEEAHRGIRASTVSPGCVFTVDSFKGCGYDMESQQG